MACAWALLTACEMTPPIVNTTAEVDAYLLNKKVRSACVGLASPVEAVREHTARRLAELKHQSIANDCLCEAAFDEAQHRADEAILRGLGDSRRDDLALCAAAALDDPEVRGDDRVRVVHGVGRIGAAAAFERLAALLDDGDPEIRAAAILALKPSKAQVPRAIQALAADPDAGVRAASATMLGSHRSDAVSTALTRAAKGDEAAVVRAAAVTAAYQAKAPSVDDLVCDAVMNDADEAVRLAGIQAWHGTKRASSLKCLDRRMSAEELSGSVRQALLDAVKASPSTEAADMLCRHIAPWARLYIKDKVAPDIDGHNIVRAQNDRDFERSYECVERALRAGGLSCYARNYLGQWMNDLGGKAPTPWCPGMVKR